MSAATSYQARYQQLNKQQKQAVDQIEGPVLVVAGPGTGKTQLLAMRIANILRSTDTLPENILCLTFTDSAAITMRERLVAMIGREAYGLTISTYHAFGSELLRRYPEYFDQEADFQAADDLVLDRTFRKIMSELPYGTPLKHEVFLKDVKQLVSDCRRSLISPSKLREIAVQNQHFIDSHKALTRQHSTELSRVSKRVVNTFQELLDGISTFRSGSLPEGSILPLSELFITSLAAALQEFEATDKTSALSSWKSKWLTKDNEGLFVITGSDQNKKLHAAADIYDRYLEALEHDGYYDYDDMILRAVGALEASPDLRFNLQERYLYLLLDEYQDTNPAQDRIVQLLTDNPLYEGRPNVLAVGDDDQAIYAFQGADYSHMLNFTRRYRDVEVITLTTNYRSEAAIVDCANQLADQITTRLGATDLAINKVITAASSATADQATLQRHHFKSDVSQNAWVARHIKTLIDQGLPANEIAVLAPQHKYLESLVPFLSQYQVPVHYEKRENILEDPVIERLITMAHLVISLKKSGREADGLWPTVLSYDCWQIATSVLWDISWQAKATKRSWSDVIIGNPQTSQIGLFFIRLSQMAEHTSLEQIVDYLLGFAPLSLLEIDSAEYLSPFAAFYLGDLQIDRQDAKSYWQTLSNITLLRDRLRSYLSREAETLRVPDFLQFVREHNAAGIKILNTNVYQESDAAIELMTAYKAKGQEYQAVYILACNDEAWSIKARGASSRISLPANLQFIRYAGATEDERLRLLYVALTRAKSRLFLTSYSSSLSGAKMTPLRYLNEYQEADATISPLLPKATRQVFQETEEAMPTLFDVRVHWSQRAMADIKQPSMRDLIIPRLTRYQLSPTELNAFLDVSRDGPTRFLLQAILHFPTSYTASSSYGTSVHKTIEWATLEASRTGQLPDTAKLKKFFEKLLRQAHLESLDTTQYLARGNATIESYMKSRGEELKLPGYSEYSFRNEGVMIGEARLTGTIDRLIVDKEHKTITVVDYKTGTSHSHWDRSLTLHFYKYQLYFYKILIENSRTFKNYRVTDAYLDFVEPDKNDTLQQLHIVFDDDVMSMFTNLIQAVWQRIMQLDMPDITGYSPNTRGVEKFEQTLIEEHKAI